MEYVKDKVNEFSENVQSTVSGTQAQGDKGELTIHPTVSRALLTAYSPEVAKGNTDAGIGTRISAAGDYLGDKKDEKSHEVQSFDGSLAIHSLTFI